MNTTELIKMLQKVEHGVSGRARTVNFEVNGKFISEPEIKIAGTGDGCAGAELMLSIKDSQELHMV
jgi:hypothetical protein